VRLAGEVEIERADDDAGMCRHYIVKPDEVAAVERQDRPPLLDCELEHSFIGKPLIALPKLFEGSDVMSEGAELLGDGEREVLVGEKAGHSSGGLVVADLAVDLLPVHVVVAPRVHQVFGT